MGRQFPGGRGELPLTPQTFDNVTGDVPVPMPSKQAFDEGHADLPVGLFEPDEAGDHQQRQQHHLERPTQEPLMIRHTIMKSFLCFSKMTGRSVMIDAPAGVR
jgi:hypothetical protein